MSYSKSEPDFSHCAINSVSNFVCIFYEPEPESDDCESDFSSVFMNLDICIFLNVYLHYSK